MTHYIKTVLTWILLLPVYVYKLVISPFTPASCRFQPTCSSYAVEAIKKHGPLKGGWLALRRFSRCHPWGDHGYDPVPKIYIKKFWVKKKADKESINKND